MISVSSDLDAVTAGCCADCGQLVLRRTPWFDEKAKLVAHAPSGFVSDFI